MISTDTAEAAMLNVEPTAGTWLHSEASRRPLITRGSERAWTAWLLTSLAFAISIVFSAGPGSSVLFSICLLLLAWSVFTHWQFSSFPGTLTDSDRCLIDDSEEEQTAVDLEIVQNGFVTGRDRGLLWIESGRLIFHGHRSSFVLRPQDIGKHSFYAVRQRVWGSRLRWDAWTFSLDHPSRSVRIVVGPLRSAKTSLLGRFTLRELIRMILADTPPLSLLQPKHRMIEQIGQFAERNPITVAGQTPPLGLDPLLQNLPSSIPIVAWTLIGTAAVCSLFGHISSTSVLPIMPTILLLFSAYRLYSVSRWQCLVRQLRKEGAGDVD